MTLSNTDQFTALLADNYSCLYGMYRRGEFEGSVGVAAEVSPGEGQKFYVLGKYKVHLPDHRPFIRSKCPPFEL
jgi:hypothetical protein